MLHHKVNRFSLGLALAVTSTIFVVGRLAGMGTMDDAFITFRCSQNFANGHGLVYNAGQAVEATSNFLYAIVIGLGMKIGANPDTAALILNFVALAALLYFLAVDAGVTNREALWDTPRILGIIWAVALQPAFWVYTHSGMETVVFSALLFGGFWDLVRCLQGRSNGILAGVWIGLAATIRMEAAAFMAPAIFVLFLHGDNARRWKRVIAAGALFGALFIPVTAYRYWFYGYIFPNTYYAKVDGGSFALAERGVIYVAVWLATTLPALAVLIGAVAAFRKSVDLDRRLTALGLAWVAGYVAYNIYVGGDYFAFGRFFVPVLPVLAWMTPSAYRYFPWRPVKKSDPEAVQKFARRAIIFVLVALVVNIAWPPNGYKYYSQMELVSAWARIGEVLEKKTPSGTTLFLSPAGAMPYFSGLKSYDSLGLTDTVTAHKKYELGRGVPGHEKTDFSRVRELDPDLVFFFVEEPGLEVNMMIDAYFEVRERYDNGELVADDQINRAASYEKRQDTTMDFVFSTTMLGNYDLMELRYLHDRALFFVKKTASMEIKGSFLKVKRPRLGELKAMKP